MQRYATITKVFRFEAAHMLPGHRGKCARLHGHSYRLDISVRGPIKESAGHSDDGMVMDFDDLSRTVRETIITPLDHSYLNEVIPVRTTAENLAHWIWDTLVAAGFPDHLISRIRVWETENSHAEITPVDRGKV